MPPKQCVNDYSEQNSCRSSEATIIPSILRVICMLHLSHEWANLWGRREGRVDCHWADRAVALVVPIRSRTPLPPVGHSEQIQGFRPAFTSVEADSAIIRIRSTRC